MTDAEVLQRIATYFAHGGGGDVAVEQVGPFAIVLHRTSDAWYLSYATPTAPIGDDPTSKIRDVLAAFERAGRVPSFEWVEQSEHDLAAALVGAGFPEPEVEPLLVVDPDALVMPDVEGAHATLVTSGDDIAALRSVAHEVFPELGPLTDAEVDLVASEIAGGRRVQAAVFVDGRPVAVGDHAPSDGVTEITGIGTLPGFRRRGLGGLVTATLAADAFASGCAVVYLTAASDGAASVYRRIGFRRIATARTTSLRATCPDAAQGPRD